ncbi:DUF1501 domain-containing protein [Phenylobacterium sp. J426]|uniref:DUF1501 domain-containing protein n=1 Tax=Phenylobacterium sp. J426 TaxID=2898439 RepID=UPI002151BB82|nr:DUF1501 domain-containing protein [Phenylobacterium sp. J426]
MLGELFARRELIVVHAAASPYRERSHFDGQQVLESGGALPRQLDTGWLNRALTAIPTGPRPTSVRPIGVGRTAPLILTGAAPVTTWAPPSLQGAGADIYEQLSKLYASTDPEFAAALHGASALRGAAGGSAKGLTRADRLIAEAQQVARLAAGPEGPRVLALTIDAWDTHEQAFAKMATPVAVLDGVVGAFRDALGPLWRDTCILAVTEFGRTARLNGTRGTDHGTASVAFVAGGGVSGGRVLADWPGVAGPQLHEGRDLRPTLDLRGLAKGLLMEAFDLHRSRLDRDVFPGSASVPALVGLLA